MASLSILLLFQLLVFELYAIYVNWHTYARCRRLGLSDRVMRLELLK